MAMVAKSPSMLDVVDDTPDLGSLSSAHRNGPWTQVNSGVGQCTRRNPLTSWLWCEGGDSAVLGYAEDLEIPGFRLIGKVA